MTAASNSSTAISVNTSLNTGVMIQLRFSMEKSMIESRAGVGAGIEGIEYLEQNKGDERQGQCLLLRTGILAP